jgi:hypothetical protein
MNGALSWPAAWKRYIDALNLAETNSLIFEAIASSM